MRDNRMAKVLLNGQWQIAATSFPMWLKAGVTAPSIEYKEKHQYYESSVQYFKHGKLKTIKGTESPDKTQENHYTWKGVGWMRLLKSHWHVVEAGQDWIVIYFSKTLFTPKGMDLLVRDGCDLSLDEKSKIADLIHQSRLLIPLAQDIVWIR